MGIEHFFDETLKRKLDRDIKKRAKLEESESRDMADFYRQVSEEQIATLQSWVDSKGHKHEQRQIKVIRERIDAQTAVPNDAMALFDLFEEYVDKVD